MKIDFKNEGEAPISEVPKKFFRFTFSGKVVLHEGQIWPNGNAPENPSTRDVIDLIEETCDDACDLIEGWNLGSSVEVDVHEVADEP